MNTSTIPVKKVLIHRAALLDGALWSLFAKVVGSFGLLVISAFLVRVLSKAEVGTFLFLINFVFVIGSICQVGITSTVIKHVGIALAKSKNKGTPIFDSIIIVTFTTSIFCLIYYFFLASHLSKMFSLEEFQSFRFIIVLWIGLRTWQILVAELFRANHNLRLASFYGGTATNLLGAALVIWIYYYANDITLYGWMACWLIMSAAISTTSVLILSSLIREAWRSYSISIERLFNYLRESIPICLSSISVIIVSRSDLWVVSHSTDTESLASYAVAGQLSLVIGALIPVVNGVLSPMIPNYMADERKSEVQDLIRAATSISSLISISLLIIFSLIGQQIIGFIYGPGFEDALAPTIYLGIAQLVYSYFGAGGYILLHRGHQKTFLMITLVSAITSVSTALVLSGMYSIVGVAFGYATGLIFQTLACATYSYKLEGIRVDADMTFSSIFRLLKLRRRTS
jgi:O-antigen/teichoic acid export membrane protein